MSAPVLAAISFDADWTRSIPDDMRIEHALEQMRAYLGRDLKAMFDEVVLANGGKVPRLIRAARERCYELNRCRDELPVGRRPSVPRLVVPGGNDGVRL